MKLSEVHLNIVEFRDGISAVHYSAFGNLVRFDTAILFPLWALAEVTGRALAVVRGT